MSRHALSVTACMVAILALVAATMPPAAASVSEAALPGAVIETADLLPTYGVWTGEGRVRVPGVFSTRRVRYDPESRRPVEVELALASPTLVRGDAAWGANRPPRIALTFDDGPDSRFTPALLDILSANDARATFFVLGLSVTRNGKLVKRMADERHEIGIHTWWHANLTKLTNEAIADDLRRSRAAIDAVIDRPIRWVRPPYGAVDSRVANVIGACGYEVAMWSVDPHDWTSPGSGAIATRILREARDGAVVLLHDGGGNRAGTVAAMRTVVPELKARGFELVTLSELTGLAEPPPVDRGMILSLGEESFEISARFDDVKVEVDGVEVEIGQAPVMTRDQFLLPARPVLEALGTQLEWDPQLLAVTFQAPRGEFMVKLNSLDATRNGNPLFVQLPSVYYHGVAMIPAWLIANAYRVNVQYDPERRVIGFFSSTRTQVTPIDRRQLLTLRTFDGAIISGLQPYATGWSRRFF